MTSWSLSLSLDEEEEKEEEEEEEEEEREENRLKETEEEEKSERQICSNARVIANSTELKARRNSSLYFSNCFFEFFATILFSQTPFQDFERF